MKQIIFILAFSVFSAAQLFAQTPQLINFQAVARDNNGSPKANQGVSVFFNIQDANNNSVYQELQSATTDACGMFNLKIGEGNGLPIPFSQIDWSSGTKNLEVKVDGVTIGNQQMVSVPFSLYAEKTKLQAGNGISVTGNTITNTAPSTIITVNSSNMNAVTPDNGDLIIIDGDLSLSGTYSKLSKDFTSVIGGSIIGNGQSISIGNYAVVKGVKFNNVKITGSWVKFEGCTFSATTELPFDAVLTDCNLNSCDISSQINQINNCTIIGGTYANVKRTTNSLIAGSSWGGNGNNFFIGQIANCMLSNNTEIEINLAFTGNYCEDSKIRIRNSRNTITVTGNDFTTSSSGPLTDLINIDMNSGSNLAVNIANNNFLGSSTAPNGEFIRLYGNYSGTRTITKISNNIVIGGSGKFISYECTGSPAPDLMVNDNDLRSVGGGLGVTTGGFIEIRNNVIH